MRYVRPRDATVETLQDLLQRVESAQLFAQAALDRAEDTATVDFIADRAGRRARLAAGLRKLLRGWDAEPEPRKESFVQALQRDWAMLAHRLDRDKPRALLTEMQRRDDMLLRAYREALQQTTHSAAERLLWRQHEELAAEHQVFDELAHSAAS